MSEHHVVTAAVVAPEALSHDAPPRHATEPSGAIVPRGMRCLLTVEAMLLARPQLAPALRAAGCEVRAVERWDALLDAIERECITAILVDLDAANRAAQDTAPGARGTPNGARMLSGDRLVALVARQARVRRFVLVVQTALDFAEIEGLIRHGVHALIHPRLQDDAVAACIKRTMEQAPPLAYPAHPADAPAMPRADVALAPALMWGEAGWPAPSDTTIPPAFG